MHADSFPFTANPLGFTSGRVGLCRVCVSGFFLDLSYQFYSKSRLLFWAPLVHSQGKECTWHIHLAWLKHGTFPYLTDRERLSGGE